MTKVKNKGITLIALIISIIILLILAGVTIAELTGNGLFARAQEAREKSKISQYIEAINLARTEANMDKITSETQDIDILAKIQEILEKQDLFKNANFNFDSVNGILTIITEEGYVFEVTDNGQKYLGKSDEINTIPSKITTADVGFESNPSGWTNDKVIVTISINKEEYKKYKIQYSFDAANDNSWIDYSDGGIEVTENKTVYARLTDGENSTNYIQENVINIDKTNPNESIIELSSTSTDTLSSIKATVKQSDEQSGLDISNCKWVYNTTSTEIGIDVSKYTGGTFASNNHTLTLSKTTAGTYYLHVLTTDVAGNVRETISDAVTVEVPLLAKKVNVGNYVAYDATNNYSYTSPVGTGSSHGNGDSSQTFTSSSSVKWQVLSKDTSTGEVVLISSTSLQSDDGNKLVLKGGIGYLYAEEELNKICAIYGHGTGANTDKTFSYVTGDLVEGTTTGTITGSGARSINVNDINNITGYTPTTGSSYTHSIYYAPTTSTSNGVNSSAVNRTDTNSYYEYSISGQWSNLLFKDNYWLASRCVNSNSTSALFNVFYVKNPSNMYSVSSVIMSCASNSSGSAHVESGSSNIRPIVYLKTTVKTNGQDSNGAWIIIDE